MIHETEYVSEVKYPVSEICNFVSDDSDLRHGSFECTDPVVSVRVDGVAPLSGDGSTSGEVASA